MKKNKFLTAFAMTMLGSCVGFSSEFKDGYDLSTTTPKKAVREIKQVVIGEDTINVTPLTERRITEAQARLLTNTAIKAKVATDLEGKPLHPSVYALAMEYGIEEEQEKRDAENEKLLQIARKKQAEIDQENARYDMLLSVRKHTKEYAEEVESLTRTLESYRQAGRVQSDLSQQLSTKIDALNKEILEANSTHEEQMRELSTQLTAERDTSAAALGREELHTQKIKRLEGFRKKLQEEHRAAEEEKQSLAARVVVLTERLQHQVKLAAKKSEALSELPIKFALTEVESVIDHDEDNGEHSLVGDNLEQNTASNSSVATVIPATESKLKPKVKVRPKTNLDDDA